MLHTLAVLAAPTGHALSHAVNPAALSVLCRHSLCACATTAQQAVSTFRPLPAAVRSSATHAAAQPSDRRQLSQHSTADSIDAGSSSSSNSSSNSGGSHQVHLPGSSLADDATAYSSSLAGIHERLAAHTSSSASNNGVAADASAVTSTSATAVDSSSSSSSSSRQGLLHKDAAAMQLKQKQMRLPSKLAAAARRITESPEQQGYSSTPSVAPTQWRTIPYTPSSSSSDVSSNGNEQSSSSASSSSSSSSSSPQGPGRRLSALSNMLAAATERLQASPAKVSSPLRVFMNKDTGSSSLGAQQHTSYPLPAYSTNEQQQLMLAKATAVVERIRAKGFSAFIVGGWVRDVYLQRPANDVDIATSASPARVKTIFAGDHMVDLPRSTVKLTHQGQVFELSFYKGVSRSSSLFSVGMDAVCRDFTINALYYDPATNEVLDFVGGVEDAQSCTLRLTGDNVKRLTEDPLRVLRGVRFATVLGLKLAPGTALAMKQYAHMCSLNAGVPPRRIWLELRKLAKAEVAQPGSWPHALKLSYHLGLLPHLLPWLMQQQPQQDSSSSSTGSRQGAAAPTVIDVFGHGVSTVSSLGSSSSGSSAAVSGSNGSSGSSPSKAVLVAERLSKLWQQQQQQRPGGGASGSIPLPLLVAATVYPSVQCYAVAKPYLAQLFPDPQEWDSIQTLMAATRLLKGAPELSSSSSSSDSSNTSSSSVGAGDSLWLGEGAAESAAWAQFYSHPHASVCLMVLSSWLPEALAAGFLRSHLARLPTSSRP